MNEKRVSFDLDEVLFVDPSTHKTEAEPVFPFNLFFKERVRLGTRNLIPKLQEMGFEVWIYTSSYRSERYIRSLFRLYGIRLDGIVNAQRHNREVQRNRREILPQKMPNHYHITLHIDDESVIMTNGKAYGFNVFLLDAQDDEWESKIIATVRDILKREELSATGTAARGSHLSTE